MSFALFIGFFSWNHKNLNLGLVQNPNFRVDLKTNKLGIELLMFYYVEPRSVFLNLRFI